MESHLNIPPLTGPRGRGDKGWALGGHGAPQDQFAGGHSGLGTWEVQHEETSSLHTLQAAGASLPFVSLLLAVVLVAECDLFYGFVSLSIHFCVMVFNIGASFFCNLLMSTGPQGWWAGQHPGHPRHYWCGSTHPQHSSHCLSTPAPYLQHLCWWHFW